MVIPKVFISYSWHPEENKIRVQRLAERLMSDGVDVILDVWSLQDGQDKYVFMEKMVTDPEIKKVLVVCNKDYAEKANSRKGGVGTESTIMSDEIYSKAEQTKFLPIVFEKGDNQEIYMPHFMKSRIYVDMSSEDCYEQGYDQLLRDIYEKPLVKKPSLGSMPAYLENGQPTLLSTAKEQRFLKLIGEQTASLRDWMELYFVKLIASLSQFKVTFNGGETKDLIDLIENSIESMQAINNDFVKFLKTVASNRECTGELFVDFFEKLLQYYEDEDIDLATSDKVWYLVNDNYRFFNYELFLSFVATMLSHERFDIVRDVVSTDFCVLSNRFGRQVKPLKYAEFQKYNYTLDRFKKGLANSNQYSEAALLLRSKMDGKMFERVVEADILLYYLSLIYNSSDEVYGRWFPELSIYNTAFSVLPKLVSCRYFEKAKVLFGVKDKENFIALVKGLNDNLERDGYHRIPYVQQGLGLDKVCSIR